MIGRTIKLFLLNLYVPKSKRVKQTGDEKTQREGRITIDCNWFSSSGHLLREERKDYFKADGIFFLFL